MSTDYITWIQNNILDADICPENTRWYLFGSVLLGNSASADIDLLVIYENALEISSIRKNIGNLELQRPLDLIFMKSEEERELRFIKSERCVQIFPKNMLKGSLNPTDYECGRFLSPGDARGALATGQDVL